MKTILVLFLVIVAINSTRWFELETYTFDDYIIEFAKSYTVGSDEYNTRKAIFEDKLQQIQQHNKNSGSTYKKGVNKFSDMTSAEFKQYYLGFSMDAYKTVNQGRTYEYVSYANSQVNTSSLPTSVDWREQNIITAVKDQGMCGSCWAHASTEQVESYCALNTGLLRVLSAQQITACAPNPQSCGGTGGCQGSIAELAFDYVQANGLSTEWKVPYQSYWGNSPSCDDVLQVNNTKNNQVIVKNSVFVSGYNKLIPNNQTDVLIHIATVGPLAVNVQANTWSDYEEGVYDGCSDWDNVIIDHVVQMVGYGTDPQLGDYFLIRNSWDATWGEKGYIRLKRQDTPQCGTDPQPTQGTGCAGGPPTQNVCGQCGVLFDTSYPLNATISGWPVATNTTKQ